MPDDRRTGSASRAPGTLTYALLVLILLSACVLRVYRLSHVPEGVDYDEAGNYVLAGEIAAAGARPVFIRAYAGREAVFYWLAAASMRWLGTNLYAFRLAAALCGLGTVLLTYALGRELFDAAPAFERRWVPLLSAAIAATSYWHVHVSRYGFRANAMPLFVAASTTLLLRGLRRRDWLDLIAAGALCGFSANTYLAIRAFPLVLLPLAAWIILCFRPAGLVPRRSWRWERVRHIAVFCAAALLALAPLALFFLREPAYFGIRMGQASVFDPEIHGGDLWGTLARVTVDALGVFTVRGDADPIYNIPGKPIYGPLLGAAFYLGLLLCIYRAVRPPRAREPAVAMPARTPYLLILVWLPVMLIPNILGARGVPHALRSIGLIPAVYYVPALALAAGVRAAVRGAERLAKWRVRAALSSRVEPAAAALLLVALVVGGGVQTGRQYHRRWATSRGAYYNGSASLRRAATYLDEWDPHDVSLWVSNDTYRHTTYAAMCDNYPALRWVGKDTLVLPTGDDRPALYVFDFTSPLDGALARHVPPASRVRQDLGPDGGVGYEAYLLQQADMARTGPQVAAAGNLGNVVSLLGYDLNAPPASGGTLDVTLYWRALRDGDRDDYAFFAHLVDELGFRWGEQTFFAYPSLQWRTGDLMLYRRQIDIAAGAPPGSYWLDLGVVSASLDARLPLLNGAGQMAGTAIRLGPFEVGRARALPDALPPMERTLGAAYPGGLTLLGADRDRGDLRPGETLALTLYWQSTAPLDAGQQVALALHGTAGQVDLWRGDPAQGRHPFADWGAAAFVRDRYALRLPVNAPPGDYTLRVTLLGAGGAAVKTTAGDSALDLYTIHVQASERTWAQPAFANPVGAELGGVVELLGYDLDRERASTGETVHLTLVWRCLAEMETSYTVFTHLLDGGGQVRGQQDNPPVGGSYPTTLWVPGEYVVDDYAITIHADAPAGAYVLEVGMYDPVGVQRLPVRDPSGSVGDRVLLGAIAVE